MNGTMHLTEYMHASIRDKTTHHHNEKSLAIFIGNWSRFENQERPVDISAYDEMDWIVAEALARWILAEGDRARTPEPDVKVAPCAHCGCPRAYITQEPTIIYEGGDRHTQATVHCQLCGAMTQAHAKDYQTARDEAMRTWEARA